MTLLDRPAEPPAEEQAPEPRWRAWTRPPILPVVGIWVVLTVLLVVFALVVPARLMGPPASSTMREIESTFTVFSLAAAPVAAMVWAILLYSLVKWRHRGSEPPTEPGPQVRGNNRLQVVWLVVSSALCLFLLVWGLVVLQPSAGEAAATTAPTVVDVTGNQWAWTFAYPEAPGAQSEVLYLPLGKRVLFRVTSVDVVHSFWIDQMGVKIDANPGATTTIAVTPVKLGVFTIRCAELCGLYHSYMQTHVHVVSPEEYQQFVQASVSAPLPSSDDAPPVPGAATATEAS